MVGGCLSEPAPRNLGTHRRFRVFNHFMLKGLERGCNDASSPKLACSISFAAAIKVRTMSNAVFFDR